MRAHWGGKPVPPRTRVTWSVRLWDENNIPGEWSSATFETGLPKGEPWRARWIAGDYDVDKRRRYPVDCFCKRFPVSGAGRARLYITACGLYEAQLNGSRVGDFVLAQMCIRDRNHNAHDRDQAARKQQHRRHPRVI